jgi:hypothetical protein
MFSFQCAYGMQRTMATSKDKSEVLASGLPPWHASGFIGALLAISVILLPSPESLDELAKIETFTHRVFPDLVSLRMLAILRLITAISIWSVTVDMIFFSEGMVVHTTYKAQSKLKNSIFRVSGVKTLCPFTSWCWIMLGSSFSLNSYIALMTDMGMEDQIQPWTLRLALILWELCAPFALLVSAVVRYAIWPTVLASGKPHNLGSFRNQMQHNTNSIYALTEMALLGGLPLHMSHLSYPCLVGISYILFTWGNCYLYAQVEEGPQYIYWFMDTTLEKTTTIALASLVFTLFLSFAVFGAIEHTVEWTGASLFTHTLCVVLVSSLVMKTK